MKKNILITAVILICIAVIAGVCLYKENNSDAVKFKNEYESLNGVTNSSGKTYLDVEISSSNPIVYSDYEEIFSILDGGTGVIYFGFPECPWCRNSLSALFEAADVTNTSKIYYLNNREDRDTKEIVDGEVVTTTEGTENYYKLLTYLDETFVYGGLEDDSIKRLYFPTILVVKDGEIVASHVATVDSQDDPYTSLTDEQYDELLQIYKDMLSLIK